jgi:DNA-binding transcriptional LysR family regulator
MGYIEPSASIRSILRSDTMRVIVALAELHSVRATAEALALSPSAVSKQLRRLEDQVGRPLFQRSRQGVVPTAEGADLAQLGRRFLALVDEVGQRFDREMVGGRVRLGITDDIGLARVPDVLRHCAARFPGLEVELTVAYASELLDAIAAQRLDLALLADGGPNLPETALRLHPEPMVWVGKSDGAPLRRPLPLAVSSDGCKWRARAIQALDAAGFSYKIVCTSPSTAGQLAAARIGLGVALLPRAVVVGQDGVSIIRDGLPALPEIALGLVSGPRAGKAIRTLRDALVMAYGVPDPVQQARYPVGGKTTAKP